MGLFEMTRLDHIGIEPKGSVDLWLANRILEKGGTRIQ